MHPKADSLLSSAAPKRGVRLALILAIVAGTAACTTAGDRSGRAFYQPYRPNVQQGNWITQQQVAQLQAGMSREQVRFILGTPTLTPVFQADRWEYPYFFKPGYGNIEQRNFTVFFENERLVRWEGDEQPVLQPFQEVRGDIQREEAAQAYNERYLIPDVTEGAPGGPEGTQGTVNPDPLVVEPVGLPRPGLPLDEEAIPDPALDPGSLPQGVFGPGSSIEPLR